MTWAFNSLSRDHFSRGSTEIPGKAKSFQLPLSGSPSVNPGVVKSLTTGELSTPSLGITFEGMPFLFSTTPLDFQLPLSGSLLFDDVEEGPGTAFNSLSRDHRARFRDFSALRGFLPRHPFAQMNLKATI